MPGQWLDSEYAGDGGCWPGFSAGIYQLQMRLYKEGLKQEYREEGRAEGMTEGRISAWASSALKVGEAMGVGLHQALDILGVPGEEREAVLHLIGNA